MSREKTLFRDAYEALLTEMPDPPGFEEIRAGSIRPTPTRRLPAWSYALIAAVVVLVGIGGVALLVNGDSEETTVGGGGACPVTVPPQPGLTPPEGYPPNPVDRESVWYGTDELWTPLNKDGGHGPRKSVFWSVNFPGGAVEESPRLFVTLRRLDEGQPELITNQGEATNAYTVADGWFMIAGFEAEPGCWEVTASYKGATLSYVYEIEE